MIKEVFKLASLLALILVLLAWIIMLLLSLISPAVSTSLYQIVINSIPSFQGLDYDVFLDFYGQISGIVVSVIIAIVVLFIGTKSDRDLHRSRVRSEDNASLHYASSVLGKYLSYFEAVEALIYNCDLYDKFLKEGPLWVEDVDDQTIDKVWLFMLDLFCIPQGGLLPKDDELLSVRVHSDPELQLDIIRCLQLCEKTAKCLRIEDASLSLSKLSSIYCSKAIRESLEPHLLQFIASIRVHLLSILTLNLTKSINDVLKAVSNKIGTLTISEQREHREGSLLKQ